MEKSQSTLEGLWWGTRKRKLQRRLEGAAGAEQPNKEQAFRRAEGPLGSVHRGPIDQGLRADDWTLLPGPWTRAVSGIEGGGGGTRAP